MRDYTFVNFKRYKKLKKQAHYELRRAESQKVLRRSGFQKEVEGRRMRDHYQILDQHEDRHGQKKHKATWSFSLVTEDEEWHEIMADLGPALTYMFWSTYLMHWRPDRTSREFLEWGRARSWIGKLKNTEAESGGESGNLNQGNQHEQNETQSGALCVNQV